MKPADNTADIRALVSDPLPALAGFVRLPGAALQAWHWPQVKPMPRPVIRGKQ